LQGKPEKMVVKVLNGRTETFHTAPVDVVITSLDSTFKRRITAFTADNVTGDLEAVEWRRLASSWRHLRDIPFADLGSRRKVDVLIGIDNADLHLAWQEVQGAPGEPIARRTPIGWTCIGRIGREDEEMQGRAFFCHTCQDSVADTIKKLLELEDAVDLRTAQQLPAKSEALVAVQQTLKRVESGYEVGIPWRQDAPQLPSNREAAERRLVSTERRLIKEPELGAAYNAVLDGYLKKGYIRKVDEADESAKEEWLLPHFAVVRPDKATTKVRVVFDGAAQHQGICLNDVMHPGPKLQNDLLQVLLRFRRGAIAVACDIEEMYLRIQLQPEDRNRFRFLWRNLDQTRQPEKYEFQRVVFGASSSPFLAQYVTQEHARRHQNAYPLAAATILRATYMDDSLDSADSEPEAIRLYNELVELWAKAGMRARKWLSNSRELLRLIPEQERAAGTKQVLCNTPVTSKALGVRWSASDDSLAVAVDGDWKEDVTTKRQLLRVIARLFDPCGFVAPFAVRGKILLQEVWQQGSDWDDHLDPTISATASRWAAELPELQQIGVARCLRPASSESEELHVFVDASQAAFGAVAYLRTLQNSQATVRLVASKSRVAPVTACSIPRLELMAAVLGVRLAMLITQALDIEMKSTVFWTDSANVLWWIRGKSRTFKPFVANRVAQIHELTSSHQWRHVPTKVNPADVVSRGCGASELVRCHVWWNGPEFLHLDVEQWPPRLLPEAPADQEKRRGTATVDVQASAATTLFGEYEKSNWRLDPERFSSFQRLRRTTAWVMRFLRNCRMPGEKRQHGELSIEELQEAEEHLLRTAQQEAFSSEITALRAQRSLPPSSPLRCLQPMLDSTGVARVDGRLKFSQLPYQARHPVILPRKSWTTQLIIQQYHEQGHGGTNQTLAALSEKFWVMSAREAIRECERRCATCRMKRARPGEQQMAPLPDARLRHSLRAFTYTAVDYGGPCITIQGRGKRRKKRYLALFTCLETRAVHLEMAASLDADDFLKAFFRMMDRRGVPKEMFSDNGGNFIKGEKELRQLWSSDKDRIQRAATTRGIRWHFQPPAAPHFGGAHEVMIKAAKRAILVILGDADVTDEELMSAFTGAEALLNSRPLTYQTANAQDDEPLTPNHFLHGQAGGRFAPEIDTTEATAPRRRWRRVQELVRHVWRRWMREWLPGLNPRKRWADAQKDLQVGDVVLAIKADSPRGHWPLGRVTEIYPGRDGRVRVAKVQVGDTSFVRPVTKLCVIGD
jgi:hypothetical protein